MCTPPHEEQDVLELLERKLLAAVDRHPVGAITGRLLLREGILRLPAGAEDEGHSGLTLWEVDDRLTDKPAGTSIRRVVDEPEHRLDLIYRARTGGLSRWMDDRREVAADAIWHEPTVQCWPASTPLRRAAGGS